MAWISVPKFDANVSIPLMVIQDEAGSSRLSISIEKSDLRHFSIKTQKGMEVFSCYQIPQNEWIHCTIVHQKPRLTSSSASLFINGKLVESLKCSYLGHPGSIAQTNTYFGISPSEKAGSDYTVHLGPCYMFAEHLLDIAIISLIYEIGFEYAGSWQGSWSKYLAGNELLRSKAIKIASEELNSPIGQLNFVLNQGKAAVPLDFSIPEDKVLFALSAGNKLPLEFSDGRSMLFFNGSFPKYSAVDPDSRLIQPYGNIFSFVSRRLVDSLWALGGISILISFIDTCEVAFFYLDNGGFASLLDCPY